MKLGEIYVWETRQAAGHPLRKKYHIFLCEEDHVEDHTFLFISSIDYGGDYKIAKADYSFLSYDSFISITNPIYYSTADLQSYTPQLVGQLTKAHMQELFNKIQGSDLMTGRDIKRCCNALKAAF